MSGGRTVKKAFFGETRRKKKSRKTKSKVVVRLYWELSEIVGCQEMEEERVRRLYMLSFWRRHWLNYMDRMAVNKKGSLLSHLHCWLEILRHTSVSMVTEQGLETWRIKALGNLEMKRENMKIRAEFFVTLLKIVKGEYLLCLNTKP
jgi:hypothetical protein